MTRQEKLGAAKAFSLFNQGDYLKAAACYQAIDARCDTEFYRFNLELCIKRFFASAKFNDSVDHAKNDLAKIFSSIDWPQLIASNQECILFNPESSDRPAYHWSEWIGISGLTATHSKSIAANFKAEFISGDESSGARLCIQILDANEKVYSTKPSYSGEETILEIQEDSIAIRAGVRLTGASTKIRLKTVLIRPVIDILEISSDYDCYCIAPGYPSRQERYRFAFIHSRIVNYNNGNWRTLVVVPHSTGVSVERYHEGVRIYELNIRDLLKLLIANPTTTIALHSPSPNLYEEIRLQLKNRRVVFWVHGFDYQPWFFRECLVQSANHRVRYRQSSRNRSLMWQRIVKDLRNSASLVFVSEYQARQFHCQITAIGDISYSIIPNPIDNHLFKYDEKPSSFAQNILSIRPYHNKLYANDLSVNAVIHLSKTSPSFHKYFFAFIGDGPLFDEITKPLKGMPNVLVIKRFLSQHEISLVHKHFGIFLVPSRMDTHGVSRDEAMAAGTVPITTHIAAIPEFVDHQSGILCPPEDHISLATAISTLSSSPELFRSLSRNAADRIKSSTSKDIIIPKELAFLRDASRTVDKLQLPKKIIAVYGDANLNLIDGSSVWIASFCESIAKSDSSICIHVFCKAPLANLEIVAPLISLGSSVKLIEPELDVSTEAASHDQIIDSILDNDTRRPYDAFVFRGLIFCSAAIRHLQGRNVVAYLTDIPQAKSQIRDSAAANHIREFMLSSWRIGVQTPQMQDLLSDEIADFDEKTAILFPPSVPDRFLTTASTDVDIRPSHKLNIVYAGKFARQWYVDELIDLYRGSALSDTCKLYIYGDKFHGYKDDPQFGNNLKLKLMNTKGLIWHPRITRNQLCDQLSRMHIGWCFRDPHMERNCLELSTKVLEFCAKGVVPIIYPNKINVELLGSDYPGFASSLMEALTIALQMQESYQNGGIFSIRRRIQYVVAPYLQSLVGSSLISRILI